MRTVDLALFADVAAARASALEARLERARDRIRRAAIEREARRALAPETAERLQSIGLLSASDRAERREVNELTTSLTAVHELQTWVEARLAEAEEEVGPPRAA